MLLDAIAWPSNWALVAAAAVGIVVLPSLLVILATYNEMKKTKPRPGYRQIAPGLSIHQWGEMDNKLVYEEMFDQHIYHRGGISYKPGDVVLDVGANIGVFPFYVARQTSGNAQIHCFEPMPAMYDLLAANAADLSAGKHDAWVFANDKNGDAAAAPARKSKLTVIPNKLGCYDKREDVEFSFRPHCPVASTIDTGDLPQRKQRAIAELVSAYSKHTHGLVPTFLLRLLAGHVVRTMVEDGEERIKATVIPLSEYITAKGLDRIDVLKIDVECAEEAVLRGIAEEHWPRIQNLMVEAEDFAVRDRVMALLRKKGFATTSAAIREELLPGTGSELSIVYGWREQDGKGSAAGKKSESAGAQQRNNRNSR